MFNFQLYMSLSKKSAAEAEEYRTSFIKPVVEEKEVVKEVVKTNEDDIKKAIRHKLKEAGVKFFSGASLEDLQEKLLEIK